MILPFVLGASTPSRLPEIKGVTAWINTDAPLARKDLLGKVVLVEFWTFNCVNCLHTLPHLIRWHKTYRDQGLLVLGVHTPELDFERPEANVRQAVARRGIPYPVALDNDFAVWKSFDNRYWPALYLVDRKGKIRHRHVGEGGHEETERQIQALLREPL